MKHLPNILTLGNLMMGCVAIAFILNSQPFVSEVNGEAYWITGTTQAYFGSICILIAAILDLLDGMVARWLGVFSPLGKDLDSLADVVSFGVAPSMILMKMLWASEIQKLHAIDVSMWAMFPAFLVACFGALRLARFNVSPPTTSYFTGVPIPAVGLVVASFPMINLYNPMRVGEYMHNTWLLYAIIVLLCWLMVSKIRLFTLKINFAQKQSFFLPAIWLGLSVFALIFFKFLGVPISFALYILLSLAFQKSIQ